MKEDIKNFLSGILIGISNAIPGVSGGTMAVVLNIYDKLIGALNIREYKNNKRFLSMLILGAAVGIVGLSNVIMPLRKNFPVALGFSFLGLIVGSIPLIYRKACDNSKPKPYNILLGFISFIFMFTITLLDRGGLHSKGASDIASLDLKIFLLILASGIIAAIAMIIPGISGSLVMLLIGTYNIVIESIAIVKLSVLIPMGIGTIIGLVVGIQGIRKALELFPQAMYFIILGLVGGSIFSVYPGWTNNLEGYVSILIFLSFSLIAYISSKNE